MSWREIGRLYMNQARKLGPWRGLMYGLVHTNITRVDQDRRAIDRVLEFAPTPEEARRACPIPKDRLAGLAFYNAEIVAQGICDKAENSERVLSAVRSCGREELRKMKLEKTDMVGLGWKGADMALLDSGCEVPVVDIHLGRYLARTDPEFLQLLGLESYDPDTVAKKVRYIQSSENPARYDRLWRIAKRHAEMEGRPAGEWHVEVWLRERFALAYKELTEEQRLEQARRYVRTLFM